VQLADVQWMALNVTDDLGRQRKSDMYKKVCIKDKFWLVLTRWIGHIVAHDGILLTVLDGCIIGRTGQK